MIPKHGERRNWRMEKDPPQVTEFEGGLTVSTCGDRSVVEQFCGHCNQWIVVRGVMGGLRFMGFHDRGECEQDKDQEIAP